jgi:hypothetical protein
MLGEGEGEWHEERGGQAAVVAGEKTKMGVA